MNVLGAEQGKALSGVVRLSAGHGCTGTLIAENLVLTAAHCLDNGSSCRDDIGDPYLCPTHEVQLYSGTITVYFDNQNVLSGWPALPPIAVQSSPATVSLHSHWLLAFNDMKYFDIAVIKLPHAVSREYAQPLRVAWKNPTYSYDPGASALCASNIDSPSDPHACNWFGHVFVTAGYGETAKGVGLPWGSRPKYLDVQVLGLLALQTKYNNAALLGLDAWAGSDHAAKGDSGAAAVVGYPFAVDTVMEWDPVSQTGDWLFEEPTIVGVFSAFSYDTAKMWFPRLFSDETASWFQGANFLDEDQDNVKAHEDLCPTDPSTNADPDGDGLAGSCDNCPEYNPSQLDSDGDGVADGCDVCPGFDDADDADGDGVADGCDDCPCEVVNDPDDDGVCGCDPALGPACAQTCAADPGDNCPAVSNPGQDDCNPDSEAKAGAPAVGDACDPVPCVRANQTSRTTGSKWLKITQTTYFDVEPIRIRPPGLAEFEGEWGHRFCPCASAGGTKDAPHDCEQTNNCIINNSFYGSLHWQPTRVGIDQPPELDPTFVDTFRAPAELQSGGVPATLHTLYWEALVSPPVGNWHVTGSHWFHVKKRAACKSKWGCGSTGITQSTLDTLASHYWAGAAGQHMAATGVAEVYNPLGWWLPLPPDCPLCGALEVLPYAFVSQQGEIMMASPEAAYSIEAQLTPAAADALRQTTGVQWLAPAEPAGLLADAPIRLASIRLDGAEVGPALQSTPAGLDVVSRIDIGSPAPRSRFGAIFRATAGDLLVVGGLLEGGAAAGDVWRYRFAPPGWAAVPTDGAIAPGAVLAATYDGYHRRVVVLDEIGQGGSLQARLWSLDTASGAMELLGAWPRSGVHDGFALGQAADGRFVLLAARGLGVPLRVVRFALGSQGPVLEGARTTTGTPLAAPRSSHQGVDILVDRPGAGITSDHLDWRDLNPTGPKTLGDYVN